MPYGTEWIYYDLDLLSESKISAMNNKIWEEAYILETENHCLYWV